MPRTARYIEPNGYYHIISRSINETWILKDEEDFHHFRKIIREAKSKYPLFLFHYVLMNTHFHLVVQAIRKQIFSKNIAHIKWHYTQWVKRKYRWKGPLWQERFKSLPIENESYLSSCGVYVEYNPVRAGLCANPADYPYSSCRKYLLGKKDSLIDNYPSDCAIEKTKDQIYRYEFVRSIFSKTPAIGSPSFLSKFKKPKPQKMPQKKCLSLK